MSKSASDFTSGSIIGLVIGVALWLAAHCVAVAGVWM